MKTFLTVILSVILTFSSGMNGIDNSETFIEFTEEDMANIQTLDIDTSDMLFIGNSLVYGMSCIAEENDFIAKSGINFINMRKQGYYNQLKNYNCNNVLIEMGTNELAWYSEESFKEEYQILIDEIYKVNPDSNIICITIPPISQAKSNQNADFTNENVKRFNTYIEDIAKKNDLNVIYSNKYFGDILASDMTPDGVHLYMNGYKGWYLFIKDEVEKL